MNSMKKTVLALMVLLLPGAASAQLVSVQPGTGRVATTKTKKAKQPKKAKQAKAVKATKVVEPVEPSEDVKPTGNGIEATFEAGLVSQYIWRGQDLSGLSFQPSATVSWRGLSLTAEGSTSIDKDGYRDLDLTLGYQLGPVNIGVTDYWSTGVDTENRYLYYDQHKGAHIFEGNLGFTCKYFSLQGYCMFWGNDFKVNDENKRAYSTYIELGVPFRLGNLDWKLTVGGTPMESAGWWEEQEHMTDLGLRDVNMRVYEYADGPACCYAALRCTKEFSLGDLRLPVFAEINANPYLSKGYFVMGISVKPW